MNKEDLSEHDRREWDRFAMYCRAIYQAEQAGVPGDEAARAIYPDHYPEDTGEGWKPGKRLP